MGKGLGSKQVALSALGDDPDLVVQHLEEPALDNEAPAPRAPKPELAGAEHRHHRGVTGENPHLSIVRRRDDGIGFTLK